MLTTVQAIKLQRGEKGSLLMWIILIFLLVSSLSFKGCAYEYS